MTIREATGDRLRVPAQPRTTVYTLVGAAAHWKRTATGNLRLRSANQPLSEQGTLAPDHASAWPAVHSQRIATPSLIR